jgi:CRISPR-associated protein Csm5
MDRFPDRDFRDNRNKLLAPAVRKRLPPFETLARAISRFYLSRMDSDLEVLTERRFCDDWLGDFRQLLGSMRSSLDRGERMLLRIGRHSGAEAVTIANHRWLFIKGPGRPPRNHWDKTAKTLWLAGARSIDRVGLLPFGWVLVEPDDASELPALRDWCARQPKPDLAAVRARLEQARTQAAALARQTALADAQRRADEIAKAQADEAEKKRLEGLSPNMRSLEDLATKLRARVEALRGGKDKAHTALHGESRALAKRALVESWTADERRALADCLEELLPAAVQIDWKDERKKLQIAQLRA